MTNTKVSNYVINSEVVAKNGLSPHAFFHLLAMHNGLSMANESMIKMALRSRGLINHAGITESGREFLRKVLRESMELSQDNDELHAMADGMIAIFPDGYRKIDDVKYQWCESADNTAAKLRQLEVEKKVSLDYNDVINATSAYVEKFSEDTTYMSSLSNFIIKNKNGICTSELLDMINLIKKHDNSI